MPKPSQEHPESSKAPDRDLKEIVIVCTFKIKMEIPNFSQELPASKDPKEDIKDVNVLGTFKIRIDSQKSYHGCIKDK